MDLLAPREIARLHAPTPKSTPERPLHVPLNLHFFAGSCPPVPFSPSASIVCSLPSPSFDAHPTHPLHRTPPSRVPPNRPTVLHRTLVCTILCLHQCAWRCPDRECSPKRQPSAIVCSISSCAKALALRRRLPLSPRLARLAARVAQIPLPCGPHHRFCPLPAAVHLSPTQACAKRTTYRSRRVQITSGCMGEGPGGRLG